MMKGEVSWSYNESGLEFILHSAEILFNKALTIVKSGREQEAMVILRRADSLRSTLEHRVILDAMENIHGDYPYFCVPSHAIYRPSPSKLRFLKNYRPSPNAENAISPSVSAPELNDNKLHSDSDSDTCAGSSESLPLDKSKLGVSTCTGPSVGSMPDIFAASSSSSSRPMRSDLVRVIGIDMIAPVTEISTIPCAGIRISHGKLAGLMAWRLVVCLDDQKEVMTKRQLMKQRHWKDVQLGKSVVTNFLLDTGCSASPIPQETLRALGYRGSYRPGTEVMVRIQGVRTKCVIAHLGEAGRLGSQFLTSGSLTFHFAQKMDAPVLYVADESGSGSTDIPRTIEPDRKSRRLSLKEGVTALMSTLGLS
ncbi:hypothetical protein E1B28_006284 [Marasmius oreades]|nr:uncharacterized protein E1B28_006284 [Marasmius oreades]KAG7095547.1 hypothetical protein E1B28_006284 [Marasmius oreades]